jgi:hypothetical protein
MREDLLLSTLERLQDDPALVLEVMEALKESTGQWDVSLRLHEDNLFTGLSQDKRATLCRNIDAILNELKATTQEESFMTQTQIPQYDETHYDLTQALTFCRSLACTAIPSSEKPIKLQL